MEIIGKKIIIVGRAASGKDYLKTKLSKRPGFIPEVSYTTRPMREGEIVGVTYDYITEGEFLQMLGDQKMHEYAKFNNNLYGTSVERWNSSNLFIKTPGGVSQLSRAERAASFVIYLDISQEIRRSRLAERIDNNDSIERRMEADFTDFTDFTDFDIRVTNADFI